MCNMDVFKGGGYGNRLVGLLLFSVYTFLPLHAQFNTDRLVMIGRAALYYEDYVLSI